MLYISKKKQQAVELVENYPLYVGIKVKIATLNCRTNQDFLFGPLPEFITKIAGRRLKD